MDQRDSERLAAEARAALADLERRIRNEGPAPDTVGLSGGIDDFPERFLAWTWLARRLSELYELSDPLVVSLEHALVGVVHDEEMSEHQRDVTEVLAAQERGDAGAVDRGLAAFDSMVSQGPAMQMIVLTTERVLRECARKSHRTPGQVLAALRAELAATTA